MSANPPVRIVYRSFRPGDESAIEELLRVCYPNDPGVASRWRWKHLERPGFRPEEILLAESDGKILGCFHSAVLPMRFAGFDAPTSYDGDYAVLPIARGLKATAEAYRLTDRSLFEQGVVFRGGFAGIELNRRLHGNVNVPSTGRSLYKTVGLAKLRAKVEAMGAQILRWRGLSRALRGREIIVDTRIQGVPECHLVLTSEGLRLGEGSRAGNTLSVSLPYAVLLAFPAGGRALSREVAKGLISGTVRIRGIRYAARLTLSLLLASSTAGRTQSQDRR